MSDGAKNKARAACKRKLDNDEPIAMEDLYAVSDYVSDFPPKNGFKATPDGDGYKIESCYMEPKYTGVVTGIPILEYDPSIPFVPDPWMDFKHPANLVMLYEKYKTSERRFFLIYDCVEDEDYYNFGKLCLSTEKMPEFCSIFAKDFVFFVENFEERYRLIPKFKELVELDVEPKKWIAEFNRRYYKF